MTVDDYLKLITSEHSQKPNYRAAVEAIMQGFADIGNTTLALPADFDLDAAIGVQLDSLGLWVGISRRVAVPLPNVYFTWDSTDILGWDSGQWQGEFDPTTGIVVLNDNDYRTLIRAKIAANNWNSSVGDGAAALMVAFPEQFIVMIDNQDMTMDVLFFGPPLSAVEQALVKGGYLPLRPSTVQVHYYSIQPIAFIRTFAWDIENAALAGWDVGYWHDPSDRAFAFDTDSDRLGGWDESAWITPLFDTL